MDTRITQPATPCATAGELSHRRNRLAGLWAAELLGLFGQAAHDYVRSVIHPPDQPSPAEDDHERVVGKLADDLVDHVSIGEIREKMVHFVSEACRQMRKEHHK